MSEGKSEGAGFGKRVFGSLLADLYLPYDRGMGHAIESTVSAVKKLSPNAENILDLASGPGEPGCTLAKSFPNAAVICSDGAQAMVDLATQRATEKGLHNVTTMLLDLTDLSALPTASQDVVTINFAISHIDNPQGALKEIHRVLKPNGVLCGTIWQSFSVPVLANLVVTELLGEAPNPPPIDKMRFGDSSSLLDREFSETGFLMLDGHNTTGEIIFDMGPINGDYLAWKSVLISHLSKLEEMEAAGDSTIRERAEVTVQSLAKEKGWIQDGNMKLPGTFRSFCLARVDADDADRAAVAAASDPDILNRIAASVDPNDTAGLEAQAAVASFAALSDELDSLLLNDDSD